jgi:hypothetical protein
LKQEISFRLFSLGVLALAAIAWVHESRLSPQPEPTQTALVETAPIDLEVDAVSEVERINSQNFQLYFVGDIQASK